MTTRDTATRDRHRAILKRRQQPCGICGQPIDYKLPYLDPMEFVADHIVPLNKGGDDTLGNKQPAHRICNRLKSDHVGDGWTRPPAPVVPVTTTRAW